MANEFPEATARPELSVEQIAEIEARALEVKGLVGVGQFGEDMIDLCATVHSLRSRNSTQEQSIVQLRVELQRWRNGDTLPEGWTCLDLGSGFPNLYLYSRADVVEQAKLRYDALQAELKGLREAVQVALKITEDFRVREVLSAALHPQPEKTK